MNYNKPDFVLYLSSVFTTTGLYDKNLHVGPTGLTVVGGLHKMI